MLLAAAASAEEPHIGYFFPAGARTGGATEIVVGGQFIEKATGLDISGGGIEAGVTGWFKELTNQEINSLRNRREAIDQTIEKAQGEERAKLEKELAKILNTFKEQGWDETGRKRLKKFDARRQFNPQLREELGVRLQVAADAAPGPREIRVITPDGLSNPMVFQVGTDAELREVEPNDREPPADAPVLVSGAVFNGQIMPGDADRVRVPLQKGERVRFTAQARVLSPYLADAVPGWFQAVLALHDPAGRRAAYADDHLFDPDPVLSYQAPEAGDYVLEIRDAIHRGREVRPHPPRAANRPARPGRRARGRCRGEGAERRRGGGARTARRQKCGRSHRPARRLRCLARGRRKRATPGRRDPRPASRIAARRPAAAKGRRREKPGPPGRLRGPRGRPDHASRRRPPHLRAAGRRGFFHRGARCAAARRRRVRLPAGASRRAARL
ncbi:MAG: hypothetical protein U1F87_03285 [Kiritimatiellia bacterium]